MKGRRGEQIRGKSVCKSCGHSRSTSFRWSSQCIKKRKGQEKAMEKVWESWGMRRIQLIISKKLAKKKKSVYN